MTQTRHNPIIKIFWWMHLSLYRLSSGRIGGSIRGLPILLLTTTGRKTGLPRTKALSYLPRGNDFAVVASNFGRENHPAWWINLLGQPDASVQVGREKFIVHAREAEGEERESIWQAIAGRTSDYERYRSWTSRRIPVVVLERKGRSLA